MSRNVRRVPASELQRLFNALDFPGKIVRNEILVTVETDREAPPEAGQPEGTRSVTAWYFDAANLTKVAFVHYYLLPNGEYGASGRPDPKRLVHGDEILLPRK